jgi:hypothetical protein
MPVTWTQNIDNMFTTTWANRKKAAVEQMYLKTPFFFWLKEKGKVEEQRGYRRVEVPLEYGKNETVKWIGKGSTMPMTDADLFTMCYEDWKYVAVSCVRYGTEDQQNKGAARIIDYVDRKINAAERALNEEFERVVFADGSGPMECNGLQNLIAAAPTTGTVHGLDRATYAWWRNQTKTASGVFSVYGISDMRNMMNNITKYSKSEVKDIFMYTDQTTYEAFEDSMLEMKQFFNQSLIDAGFEHLVYRGRPLMWSPEAPAAKIYFINPTYLKLVIDPDYFMDMTEWKAIPDQVNDRVAQIVCAMNLVTSRPVAEGVLTGISY